MNGITVLKDSELLDEVSMDNLKGGQASSGVCCEINHNCNENTGTKEEEKTYMD